ncbi:nucleotidyltransferase family protein [Nocardia abscessus]|uniref:nucleotidyltransferase family protein n=1 Tax=Nocardia abscessus TaxID=120957 RepID=UPI002458178D|nr:NTP transferase domain-containing protein [Nocardia abscessus]
MADPDRPVVAPCAGIVLAAGAGTRYGKPKVLAEGGAWLRATVTALRDGGCDPVIVVLGATGPKPEIVDLPPNVRHVWAADWATGLSASLRAGLIAAGRPPPRDAARQPGGTPPVGGAGVGRGGAARRGGSPRAHPAGATLGVAPGNAGRFGGGGAPRGDQTRPQ